MEQLVTGEMGQSCGEWRPARTPRVMEMVGLAREGRG